MGLEGGSLPSMPETFVRSWVQEDPGGGNGKPLQYFAGKIPEPGRDIVHRVTKNRVTTEQLSTKQTNKEDDFKQ